MNLDRRVDNVERLLSERGISREMAKDGERWIVETAATYAWLWDLPLEQLASRLRSAVAAVGPALLDADAGARWEALFAWRRRRGVSDDLWRTWTMPDPPEKTPAQRLIYTSTWLASRYLKWCASCLEPAPQNGAHAWAYGFVVVCRACGWLCRAAELTATELCRASGGDWPAECRTQLHRLIAEARDATPDLSSAGAIDAETMREIEAKGYPLVPVHAELRRILARETLATDYARVEAKEQQTERMLEQSRRSWRTSGASS